ncbi:hypothetical protein [Acinetobacter haemolyticus]|uniref:hypothetical protein n=1 Tax=Acinetobacter haemolyticus TaxID=29430 RepID=UPI000D69CB47|nr:hypothetical protein [Acinetobacter haemolyticus]
MSDLNLLKELNQIIDAHIEKHNQKPARIILGYKSYSTLMNDKTFANEVTDSALNPHKRKYRKIKIKVTKDDHQLELE